MLWLVHYYPFHWLTRITPAPWLPLTERAAERAIEIARGGKRRQAAARMQAMLGISAAEARGLSRRFLAHSIRVTHLERRLGRWPDLPDEPLRIVGREHLDRALASRKGALLIMVHRFAVGSVIRALYDAGYPMTVVIRPQVHPMFGRLGRRVAGASQRRMFARFYRDVIDVNDPEVSIKIVQRLRAGGLVVIAPDSRTSKTATGVRFLGGETRVSAGVLELARVSGSPLLPFDALYEPHGLVAEIRAPLDLERGRTRDDQYERNLPRLVSALEQLVAACPEQWMHWVDL